MDHHHHHHHHHHGEGEGEGEGVQCDHTKGVPHHPLGEGEDGMDDDPLFHKQEWSLDDWVEMYNKFTEPPSAAKGEASRELVQHVGELLPSEPARVLVPLCGKSPDLRWLYERGNTVVGIEGVEKVVREFFELYPDLQHTVEDLAFGKLYRSGDGRLLVYVCNIVKVPEGILGPCNAVFDWGAYTAIRPSDRPRYVEVVKSALREHFNYFLEVCHDGPPDAVGLPHSISFRSIKLELGTSLKMRVLKTLDISAEWGVESFFNSYILLSTKDT